MKNKQIRNIKTRIRNKRQLVIIEFETPSEFVFVAPTNIKQNTGLEVYELELLIGSTLRIDFYSIGENMFNGSICKKDNLIVKEYFFELQKPVEQLRVEYANRLLPFKQIKQIFYFYKFDKDNVGIKTIDDQVIFITLKRFERISKLEKDEQQILVGSYFYPEFYNIGETLQNGIPVTQNNKILKWINLRFTKNIDGMYETFENNSLGYYDGNEPYENKEKSYYKYRGSSDGYGGSLDDDFIRDVLDGEPDAYWNID